MTTREELIEEIQRRLLTEMAITRKDFKEDIRNSYSVVICHLILILTQSKSNELNHWKGEIYGNFDSFDKLKYSKKYPTEQDFLDCGMETCFENIEDKMEYYIIKTYSQELKKNIFNLDGININFNIDKLKICIKEYLQWAIQNVDSKTGVINKSKAYQKMDELIKKYNS